MQRRIQQRGGQAIVMVTLALFTMCGMLGLAVDLGWSYYVRKSAQAAADSAALAAVQEAYARFGHDNKWVCSNDLTCQPITPCASSPPSPPVTVIDHACLYAQRNGFTEQPAGVQHVTAASGTTSPPPTLANVNVYYWVTVRVAQSVPQLFSSVLGNTWATPSARATAAVVDAPINPSLILLNRKGDYSPWGLGVDLAAGGGGGGGNTALGGNILGGSGIILASAADGSSGSGYHFAGEIQGSTGVTAPFTYIRGQGTVDDPHNQWIQTPTNGFRDRSWFQDPMRVADGQPPAPSNLTGATYDCPILNGAIDGSSGKLGPGNYYAVDSSGNATGAKLQFSGAVSFTTGGHCLSTDNTDSGGFGNYVFYGGLDFSSPHLSTASFAPGRYILAGVKASGGNAGTIFSFGNQVTLADRTPLSGNNVVQNDDAGEIFVLTDANYAGLDATMPNAVKAIKAQLQMGQADLQAGNNSSTVINLHGLNADKSRTGYANVPDELNAFRPVIFWQDQHNSRVKYDNAGQIDLTSCGSFGQDGVNPPSLDNPCPNSLADSNSPLMSLQATLNSHYYGAIYQPRGAWMRLVGSNGVISPLMLVTGSLFVQGGPTVELQPLPFPLPNHVVALVE